MSTIADIAKLAGVSKSTASLAMNGDARVRLSTRERVLEVAKGLSYRPTRAAQSLSSGRTRSLQLLDTSASTALSSGFFTRFTRGVHDAAQQQNYTVALSILDTAKEARNVLERIISEKWADGVILLNATRDEALIRRVWERRFPHVVLGRSVLETLSVDNDNERVAFDATTYLLEKRLYPIALLNGPDDYHFTQDRAKGYRAALKQAGYPVDPRLETFTTGTAEAAEEAVQTWLKDSGIRSILAVSDTLAIGALRSLQDKDLKIPEEVALVGMNNDDVADYVQPRLTSVDLNAYELGGEAASLLLGYLTHNVALGTRRIVPHRLVCRASG